MSLAIHLLVLAAAPGAEPAKQPNLACEAGRNYVGNAISPTFTLKIGGPGDRTWTYTHTDDMFGRAKNRPAVVHKGTYEIDADLAVFTGQSDRQDAAEVRFGLNFGFPKSEVAFDRFFPDGHGAFTHHRQWFRKVKDIWQPAEERSLTLPAPPPPDAKTWEVAWKGRRTRWDDGGKKTEEVIDVRVTYKRAQTDWYSWEKVPAAQWLPGDLILQRAADGTILSVFESNRYIGDLRGFHPGHATLPGGP